MPGDDLKLAGGYVDLRTEGKAAVDAEVSDTTARIEEKFRKLEQSMTEFENELTDIPNKVKPLDQDMDKFLSRLTNRLIGVQAAVNLVISGIPQLITATVEAMKKAEEEYQKVESRLSSPLKKIQDDIKKQAPVSLINIEGIEKDIAEADELQKSISAIQAKLTQLRAQQATSLANPRQLQEELAELENRLASLQKRQEESNKRIKRTKEEADAKAAQAAADKDYEARAKAQQRIDKNREASDADRIKAIENEEKRREEADKKERERRTESLIAEQEFLDRIARERDESVSRFEALFSSALDRIRQQSLNIFDAAQIKADIGRMVSLLQTIARQRGGG